MLLPKQLTDNGFLHKTFKKSIAFAATNNDCHLSSNMNLTTYINYDVFGISAYPENFHSEDEIEKHEVLIKSVATATVEISHEKYSYDITVHVSQLRHDLRFAFKTFTKNLCMV